MDWRRVKKALGTCDTITNHLPSMLMSPRRREGGSQERTRKTTAENSPNTAKSETHRLKTMSELTGETQRNSCQNTLVIQPLKIKGKVSKADRVNDTLPRGRNSQMTVDSSPETTEPEGSRMALPRAERKNVSPEPSI